MKIAKIYWAAVVAVAVVLPAAAEFTVTVTPGYQFSANERPTTDTLNQLGQPTVAVSGTVSGTVGLATNSITGVYLANSVPDEVTLTWTNTSPRSLRIKPGGVNTNELSAAIYGNITNALAVASGGAAVTTASNALYFATNYYATNLVLSNGLMTVNIPHGLGAAPSRVRAVIVCTNSQLGFAAGDEINVDGLTANTVTVQWANYGANATNVFLGSLALVPAVITKTGTAGPTAINTTNFNLKFYAWR